MIRTLLCLIALALAGCSHGRLMKCTKDLPEEYLHCPEHIQGDYRICEKPKHVYGCEEPL